MTKLIQLRVVIAVDDSVELSAVKQRLSAAITSKETESLEESGDLSKRIHWGTADVLQGPERNPGRARSSRAAAKEVPK
jgi:hypothetical protein